MYSAVAHKRILVIEVILRPDFGITESLSSRHRDLNDRFAVSVRKNGTVHGMYYF